MILRLSDSLSRGLIVAATLCVAVVLSFYSIRMAVAAQGAEDVSASGLALATRLEPGNPEYWYRRGHFLQFNLEQSDSEQAEQFLKNAIAVNSGYTDAWLDLGTAYELDGHEKEAREAYLKAKQSYPSSAEVSWRYGNFLLRQGDAQGAYPEFRRSLELDPRRAASAFSRCFRVNPNIDEILDRVFPPIPSAYVDVIAETCAARQLSLAQLIWRRLLDLHPRLKVEDFEPLVAGLLGEGETTEARRVWTEGTSAMYLPPLFGLAGSLIWDPSFESGVNVGSFSWRFNSFSQGVTIGVDPVEKHSGNQSLRLTFDGKRNPLINDACTLAIVSPNSRYIFSAWVKTRDLKTDHGVGFYIGSFGQGATGTPPVFSRELHGTNNWTFVEMPYDTGPGVNRAMVCIRRDPSLNDEVHVSGLAWVDDVNLVPQVEEPRKR